ncbi:MAG: hypothetical protein R3F05_20030 [Planctomycetota bacterium]
MGLPGWRVGIVVLLAVCCGTGVRGMADDEPANAGEVVETGTDGTVLVRYAVDAEGRKHGAYRRWHCADVLAEESMWKAGQRHGTTKQFDETGTLRLSEEYRSDALQGPRRVFDDSGTLVEQATYVRGQRHGAFKSWHGNRRLRVVTAYRDDLLEGKYQTWDESGSPVIRTTYKRGQLDGRFTGLQRQDQATEQEWEEATSQGRRRRALPAHQGAHRGDAGQGSSRMTCRYLPTSWPPTASSLGASSWRIAS